MALLRTISGSITLRNESGKVCLFHCPHAGGKGNKEVFLDKASKEGPATQVIRKVTNGRVFSSISGKRPEMVGFASEQTFDITDGEVVKVFIDTRNNYGSRHKTGCVYVRMRSAAAHRIMEFRITDHASADFNTGVLEGTFDVLTLDELDQLGVRILPAYRKFCSPSIQRRLITSDTIIRDEIEAVAKVVKKEVRDAMTGEAKEIFVQARPRRRLGR